MFLFIHIITLNWAQNNLILIVSVQRELEKQCVNLREEQWHTNKKRN